MQNHTRDHRLKTLLAVAVAALPVALAAPVWAQVYTSGGAGRLSTPSGRGLSIDTGTLLPSLGGMSRPRLLKYPLGPQDVIRVTVERFPDYSSSNIVVPPDGRISLEYFGEINVNGLTTLRLEQLLTAKINKRIRNPKVRVGIQQLRPASEGSVNVIGAVQAQGSVEILSGYRLTEVLAKVGGVSGRYDEVRASISRGGQLIPVDLYQAVSYPQSRANIAVKADDVLTVASVDLGRVLVNGDVSRPGVFEMRRAPVANAQEIPLKPRLSDVIVAAGGFANYDRMTNGPITGFVQRIVNKRAEKIDLSVEDSIAFKDSPANIQIKPDDFLTFRVELPLSVDILGNLVKVPNNYKLRPGSGVLQAIALAGGLTKDATQTVAMLQRGGLSREINLQKLLAGDTTENLQLQSGDTLNFASPNIVLVSMTGAVNSPSTDESLKLPPGATISTAIARAGGLRSTPDRVSITIVRTLDTGEQRFLAVDPVLLLIRRDPGQNTRLQSGDLINVLEKSSYTAALLGEVARVGELPVEEEGVLLSDFLARGGGVRPTGSLRNVTIRSAKGVRVVDAYDAVALGKPLDVKIFPGDFVVVPENLNRVLVTEAVNNPGFVPLPEGRPITVLEAVQRAGGPQRGARTQEIALLRKDAQGKVTTRVLALNKLREGKTADAQLVVQNGDIIAVPEGRVKESGLSRALGLFSLFNLGSSVLGR